MRRLTVAVVAILVLLVGGGLVAAQLVGGDSGSGGSTPDRTPVPAPSGPPQKPPTPELAPYYSQKLDWKVCGDNDCATMEVPLDYADPEGERIDIALLRVPAKDQDDKAGSLVVNPGGPGAPGTQYASQASQAFGKPLLNKFDIVGFDPRGTGTSTAVDCLTDDELDDYIASDPDPDDKAEDAELEGWVTKFGAGCKAKSGPLAAHVSTAEAARDLDVLRAALGEDELTYFGASYGTKLGATYADLFPKEAGQLVLDGAVDLSLAKRELDLQQAEGFEVALTAYVENCLTFDSCFLGDDLDEAMERIRTFLADADAKPVPAGDRELTAGNAFYGIAAPLYQREAWNYLSIALKSAINGDGSTLLALSDLYSSRQGGGYKDNSREAFLAINCLDDSSSIPVSQVGREIPAFEKASPTFGRSFAYGLTACQGFDKSTARPASEITGKGAPPILVVGTTRDPATPLRWAQALAKQLESGVLVTRDGDGHTGYNAGNDCVDDTIEAFLIDDKVPTADVDCPAP